VGQAAENNDAVTDAAENNDALSFFTFAFNL
jgi:hypothetical protein